MSSDQALKLDQSKVFRLPGAVVAWWAWVIFAAANLIDLAIQGRSHTAAEIAAALAVTTGLVYACALRPRVVADPGGITVMNPLRDHRVPWGSVTGVDLAESVRVHFTPEAGATREKVIHSWALYARRPNRLRTDLLRQGGRRPACRQLGLDADRRHGGARHRAGARRRRVQLGRIAEPRSG